MESVESDADEWHTDYSLTSLAEAKAKLQKLEIAEGEDSELDEDDVKQIEESAGMNAIRAMNAQLMDAS